MKRLINHWYELSTPNMNNIINCSCARYSDISTITHSAKYRLIIVIDKIPKNIEISFLFHYRTPLDATNMHLIWMVKWKWLKSRTCSTGPSDVIVCVVSSSEQRYSRRAEGLRSVGERRVLRQGDFWELLSGSGLIVMEYMRVLLFSPQLRQVLFEIFMKNYRVRRNLIQTRLTQELGDAVTKTDVDRLLKVRLQDCYCT